MGVPVPPWPHSGVRGACGGQGEVTGLLSGWREEKIGWEAQKQEHTLRLSQQLLSSAASGGRWQKFKGGGWKEKQRFKIAKPCFFFSLGCDRPSSQGVSLFFFWLSHTYLGCAFFFLSFRNTCLNVLPLAECCSVWITCC